MVHVRIAENLGSQVTRSMLIPQTPAANNVAPQQDTDASSTIIAHMVAALRLFDTAANHRARVAYGGNGLNGPAVSSDVFNGNTAAYHPVRTAYIEGEFIDFGANTPALTDDLVDILLNTNRAFVMENLMDATADGLLEDLRAQP